MISAVALTAAVLFGAGAFVSFLHGGRLFKANCFESCRDCDARAMWLGVMAFACTIFGLIGLPW